jgi:hypothetical protein
MKCAQKPMLQKSYSICEVCWVYSYYYYYYYYIVNQFKYCSIQGWSNFVNKQCKNGTLTQDFLFHIWMGSILEIHFNSKAIDCFCKSPLSLLAHPWYSTWWWQQLDTKLTKRAKFPRTASISFYRLIWCIKLLSMVLPFFRCWEYDYGMSYIWTELPTSHGYILRTHTNDHKYWVMLCQWAHNPMVENAMAYLRLVRLSLKITLIIMC